MSGLLSSALCEVRRYAFRHFFGSRNSKSFTVRRTSLCEGLNSSWVVMSWDAALWGGKAGMLGEGGAVPLQINGGIILRYSKIRARANAGEVVTSHGERVFST